jgi:hypothetical protein
MVKQSIDLNGDNYSFYNLSDDTVMLLYKNGKRMRERKIYKDSKGLYFKDRNLKIYIRG